jgi:hypothetical protein
VIFFNAIFFECSNVKKFNELINNAKLNCVNYFSVVMLIIAKGDLKCTGVQL